MQFTDVIFQKMVVPKSQLYSTLKTLLLNAGWQNISSNPATDYDVFYSTGNSGNMALYFQMRDYDNMSTTDAGYQFGIRLIRGYTPGAPGQSGTFLVPGEPWIYNYIMYSNAYLKLSTNLTLWYNVDKNRLIFAIQPPFYLNTNSSIFFIGMPNLTLIQENQSSGVLFASSNPYSTYMNNAQIRITDNPFNPQSSSYNMNVYYVNSPSRIVNSAGKVFMSRLAYGAYNTEGVRGFLDGIYVFPTYESPVRWLDGDIIVDTSVTPNKKYMILNTYTIANNPTSFNVNNGNQYVVIQIQ
jgi:hypothetical protein